MNRATRSVLSAVGLVVVFLLAGCETVPPRLVPGSISTVVIDAGHGGKDSGEHPRGGLYEKDVALDTAKRLEALLRQEGFRTVLTRSDDTFVELDDRVAIADRAGPGAILVSIHYNASPSSGPEGLETYYWRADSYGLAVRVQQHMLAETEEPHHGVIRRVLRLTHNPQVPCILCEGGYLTNPSDAARIATDTYRQRLAEGIADGIVEEREQGDANIGPLPRVATTVAVQRAAHRPVSSRRHRGAQSKRQHTTSKGAHTTSHRSGKTTKKGKSSKSKSSSSN
jgi:N-acetylmuramoyl-L-alanine amidase